MPLTWHHGGKICGQCFKRKNPTNLKVHLRSAYKEANLAYLNKVKENAKPPLPETEANPGNVTGHGCMGTGPGSMTKTLKLNILKKNKLN